MFTWITTFISKAFHPICIIKSLVAAGRCELIQMFCLCVQLRTPQIYVSV